MHIQKDWLTTFGGQDVFQITLRNDRGAVVVILNYGAIIEKILLPSTENVLQNLVLSYDAPEEYFNDPHYIGCVVGRYANRISGGLLPIHNQIYQLSQNENGQHHLHGGFQGFHKKVWKVTNTFAGSEEAEVVLSTHSPHLEEGYPGNVEVEVRYSLTNKNELFIHYKAITDQATVVSLTNHTYFTLAAGERDIAENTLAILAGRYTPANDHFIPLGTIEPVAHSVYDLRRPKKLGEIMHCIPTLNYCVNSNRQLKLVAVLSDPLSGRSLEVRTTCPGLQLYCGNYLNGQHKPFAGICLEPGYYPDAPNHPAFPSALLLPGQVYNETTSYTFC